MTRNLCSNAQATAGSVPSMNNRAWLRRMMPAAALLVVVAGTSCAQADSGGAPESASLCLVLAHPTDFSGKTMRMTVSITATKEGSFIWTPACRGLGVVSLQLEGQTESESGLKGLRDMLRSHGLSDHPVIATLTGTFTYNQQQDEHRHKAVFKASAASDLSQSERLERP
jgi:hypothetical protein